MHYLIISRSKKIDKREKSLSRTKNIAIASSHNFKNVSIKDNILNSSNRLKGKRESSTKRMIQNLIKNITTKKSTYSQSRSRNGSKSPSSSFYSGSFVRLKQLRDPKSRSGSRLHTSNSRKSNKISKISSNKYKRPIKYPKDRVTISNLQLNDNRSISRLKKGSPSTADTLHSSIKHEVESTYTIRTRSPKVFE